MSEFSEKCKELISKNNTNVYKLAKYSGIERTTLQKMVSGTRLPISREKVKEFCSYLQVSVSEERELLELYKMEKVGKNVYETRKEIQILLAGIQQYQSVWGELLASSINSRNRLTREFMNTSVKMLEYDLDIDEAIHYMIAREIADVDSATIIMNTFDKNAVVFQSLMIEEQDTNKRIICNQYINFIRKNRDDISTIENIRALKEIISFAFAFHQEYKVQYSYISGSRKESEEQLWPNFIIATNAVLLLSGDGMKGMLIEDRGLVKGYRIGMKALDKRYRLLFEVGNNGEALEEAIYRYQHSASGRFPDVILSAQFDIYQLFYANLYEKEKQNPYVSLVYNMYKNNINNMNKSSVMYFGLSEIERFIESGKLPGIYGEYTRSYSIEERRQMLNMLLKNLAVGNIRKYLLKEEFFDYNSLINIELYGSEKLHFLSLKSKAGDRTPFEFIEIKEQGICEAFQDYFMALKESEEVQDLAVEPEVLSERINQLWNEIDKKE